nr:MAG TPA: hypothetical protein [Caudoviricetes sp.]
MTREEKIKAAAQKYVGFIGVEDKISLKDAFKIGAEWVLANQWHSVADGDLPQNNTYCFFSIGINEIEIGHVMDGCVHFNSTEKPWILKDMDYWMEIPKLPK